MKANATIKTPRVDVYERVTDSVLKMLEAGPQGMAPRWNKTGGGRPLRFNGTPYQGINTILLWAAALRAGYASNTWMTYRQAAEQGGQVRKGEHGSLVVYAGKIVKSEENDAGEESERSIPFLKGYTVFNADQIDGLPSASKVAQPVAPIEAAEAFIERCGAAFHHGGDRAFYSIIHDRIHLPPVDQFIDAEGYTATKIHELTHWTGHCTRLARDFGQRFGDAAYAVEELIAELCSAFLCADLAVSAEPRADHGSYLASWVAVLKNDKRVIFAAASAAEKAADYLHAFQDVAETA